MISKTEKTIGGRTIEIHRCATTENIDLQLSIAKVAGNIDIAAALSAAKGELDRAIVIGIGEMLAGVAQKLTKTELLRLMNMLFKYVHIDGKPFRDIDEDFSDRPWDLWEVFHAALEHNLGPLVDGLRRRFPATAKTTTTT